MPDVLKKLRAEVARDLWQVKQRSTAVDLLSGAANNIGALGFKVKVERERGLLVLRFDPEAPVPVAEPPLGDGGEDIDWAPVDAGDDFEVEEAAPVDPPAPKPKPKPKPETAKAAKTYITGPFSKAETDEIVERAARGEPARKIGTALTRHIGSINMAIKRLRPRIEAAQRAIADPGAGAGRAETGAAEAPRKTAPPPAPAPAPDVPKDIDGAMSAAERAIWAHLDALPQGTWTAERDLALAEGLARGDGAPGAAEALGVGREDVIARWSALNTRRGDLDNQAALLRVLRWRVERG